MQRTKSLHECLRGVVVLLTKDKESCVRVLVATSTLFFYPSSLSDIV
jgi:hypothetical protein